MQRTCIPNYNWQGVVLTCLTTPQLYPETQRLVMLMNLVDLVVMLIGPWQPGRQVVCTQLS